MIKLTEKEKRDLREVAPKNARNGKICLRACHICGHLEWASSNLEEPEDLVVTVDTFRSPCGLCQTVNARAPEVFTWVLNVIGWSKRQNDNKGAS